MKFDKAQAAGILIDTLYAYNNKYMQLGRVYARMYADGRADINMPRLLKIIASAINMGYVVWGFNGYGGNVAIGLTDKGIMGASARAQEGLAQPLKNTLSVGDVDDKSCVGMILTDADKILFREDAQEGIKEAPQEEVEESVEDSEDYKEDAEEEDSEDSEGYEDFDGDPVWEDPDDEDYLWEDYDDEFADIDGDDEEEEYSDEEEGEETPKQPASKEESAKVSASKEQSASKDESAKQSATLGINPVRDANKHDSAAHRIVVFNGKKAFWKDTHEELTPKEYEEVFGMPKKYLVDYLEDEEDYEDYFAPYSGEGDEDEDEDYAQFCSLCGEASDLRAKYCDVCGRKLEPGVYDSVIQLRSVRKHESVARQRDLLNSLSDLYDMLLELGIRHY